jgi:hypothetical protein
MAVVACSNALTNAMASLYSYDDSICHPTNGLLTSIGASRLKFVGDAKDALPPNYKINISWNSNFQARLYCDMQTNVLILAFKGSVSLTQMDRNAIDDWINTNMSVQTGERPVQYQVAEDLAFIIEKNRMFGEFDGVCGPDRPKFILTGHSKGGGEAQFAAVRQRLEAVVFNSAPVNPMAFSDWALSPEAWLIARRINAARACGGWTPAELRDYVAYFATGQIHDVRMVNDPLTTYLFPICGNNLPHAPINWLVNTLTCSSNGHAIETVARELHACAP